MKVYLKKCINQEFENGWEFLKDLALQLKIEAVSKSSIIARISVCIFVKEQNQKTSRNSNNSWRNHELANKHPKNRYNFQQLKSVDSNITIAYLNLQEYT